MEEKYCESCKHFLKNKDGEHYCKKLVRHKDNVTGIHSYYRCVAARGRKPYGSGNIVWCGPSGKLWETKSDTKLEEEIAQFLIESSGFSDDDAERCAKEIVKLIEKYESKNS